MKHVLLSCVLALYFSLTFAQSKQNSGLKYIEEYHQLAIQEMQLTGIPASITLAQAMHESANGTSQLAKKANNHFGVKCTANWKGKRFYRNNNRRNSCFRKYETVEDAYKDRSRFLSNNKKYAFLFKYSNTDYKNWAWGLQRSGYASSKKYAKLLLKTIKVYDLQKYDVLKLDSLSSDTSKIADSLQIDTVVKPKTIEVSKQASKPKVKYHKVKSGESLYTISKKYKVSVNSIKKANNLKSNLIKPGKKLIIP